MSALRRLGKEDCHQLKANLMYIASATPGQGQHETITPTLRVDTKVCSLARARLILSSLPTLHREREKRKRGEEAEKRNEKEKMEEK